MTVYVDDMAAPFGRMLMFHMVADSKAELLAMALDIGVHPRHIQKEGTAHEHFDICKAKRAEALRRSAVEVDRAGLVAVIKRKRTQGPA